MLGAVFRNKESHATSRRQEKSSGPGDLADFEMSGIAYTLSGLHTPVHTPLHTPINRTILRPVSRRLFREAGRFRNLVIAFSFCVCYNKSAKQTQLNIVISLRSLGKSAGSDPHAYNGMMGLFGDSGAVRFSVRSSGCALFILEGHYGRY